MAMVTWASRFGTTTSTSDVTIAAGEHVRVTGNVTVRNVIVALGGLLDHDPDNNSTLNVWGYGRIYGEHRREQNNPALDQALIFHGANHQSFVGGNLYGSQHDFHGDTDRGWWVETTGVLNWQGMVKTPHARLQGAAMAGATSIPLETSPSGWRQGDMVVLTPMQPPTTPGFYTSFDERTLSAAPAGSTIALNSGLTHDHLALTGAHPPEGWTGRTHWTARAMNMSRGIRTEGLVGKRAHIIIHSHKAQTVRYCSFRHLGPTRIATGGEEIKSKTVGTQYANPGDEIEILGRYPLHLHHGGEVEGYGSGVRHLIEGNVFRDCGNHAIVAHEVTGARIRWNIAYKTQFDPFWWDRVARPAARSRGSPRLACRTVPISSRFATSRSASRASPRRAMIRRDSIGQKGITGCGSRSATTKHSATWATGSSPGRTAICSTTWITT
jgi:hypothetical protein